MPQPLLSVVSSTPDTYPPLREIINTYGLRAEKKFGQNFLLDLNITRKIVSADKQLAQSHVIEIGPGPGGLTRAALEQNPKSLTVIELDPRCIKALEIYGDQITAIEGDALEQDLPDIAPHKPRIVLGNLPYNVATPLLVKWLEDIWQDKSVYQSMILMFQKEVADRIIAKPNTKTYGRLSILSQWLCDVSPVMTLPPQAFTPPPKVHSSVLKFTPKQDRIEADFKKVEHLTALGFQQRRKMIRQSLKPYSDQFNRLGLDEKLRAENLTVAKFIQLAQII